MFDRNRVFDVRRGKDGRLDGFQESAELPDEPGAWVGLTAAPALDADEADDAAEDHDRWGPAADTAKRSFDEDEEEEEFDPDADDGDESLVEEEEDLGEEYEDDDDADDDDFDDDEEFDDDDEE